MVHETRGERRSAAHGDENSAFAGVLFELFIGGERDALDGGQDQDGIRHAGVSDSGVINVIEVVAGVEDLRDDGGTDELVHHLVDGYVAGG